MQQGISHSSYIFPLPAVWTVSECAGRGLDDEWRFHSTWRQTPGNILVKSEVRSSDYGLSVRLLLYVVYLSPWPTILLQVHWFVKLILYRIISFCIRHPWGFYVNGCLLVSLHNTSTRLASNTNIYRQEHWKSREDPSCCHQEPCY